MSNTSGGLNTRHGDMYQVKLLVLCLKRAYSTGRPFYLTTENQKQAGSFDDIVIYQQEANGRYSASVIQAKHRLFNSKQNKADVDNISSGELYNKDKKASFSIFKYFSSFCAIQQSQDFGYIKEFTLYTNADIKSKEKFITNTEENKRANKNVVYVKSVNCTNSLYKDSYYKIDFKKYEEAKENFDLINNLKNVIGLDSLAEELCNCIMKNEELNFDNEIFKIYQNALFDEVLEKQTTSKAVFKDDFIKEVNLSTSARILKEQLKNTSWKALTQAKLKLSENFKKQSLNIKRVQVNDSFDEDINVFLENEFVLIKDEISGKRFSSSTKEDQIDKIATMLANNIEEEKEISINGILEKYHLPLITEVINVNESSFFDNFVRAINISKNAKLLSQKLKAKVGPLELISLKLSKEFKEQPMDIELMRSCQILSCEQLTKKLKIKMEESIGVRFSSDTPDSDIDILADHLAASVHKNTKIDLNDLFTEEHKKDDYCFFIAHEVIDIKSSQFYKNFLDGENISEKAKKLSEEVKKRVNIFDKNVILSLDFKNVFVLPTKRLSDTDIYTLVKLFTTFLEGSSNTVLFTENKENSKCLNKQRILLQRIAGHALVYDENTKHKELIKFKSSFFKSSKLRLDLKKLRQEINKFSKNDIVRLQKYFRLKINNFKTCYERQWLKLPSENDFTETVKDFCNKFIFAKEQPNLEKLSKQVIAELGDVFNLEDSSNLSASLYEEVWKWILNHNAKEHDKQSVEALFKDMENLICKGKIMGLNSEYCQRIRNHKIKFNSSCETIKAIKCFLNNEKSLLFIHPNQSTLSATIQTEQAIREDKKFIKDDNLIFLSSEITLKDEAVNAFSSRTKNYLFVLVDDGISFKENNYFCFLKKLFDVIKGSSACKKLIIITTSTVAIFSLCNHQIDTSVSSQHIDSSTYDDVNNESKKIMKQKSINYQGCKRMLSDFPNIIIKSIPFNLLLSQQEINIGKKLELPADHCIYYSKRKVYQFYEIENNFAQLIQGNDKFVVEGINMEMLNEQGVSKSLMASNINDISCKIFISNDLTTMLAMKTVLSKQKKYNVRIIKFNNDKLFEAKTYTEEDLIRSSEEHQVVVIADMAGMGKSTFLSEIGRLMIHQNPNTWIVRVDFNKHTTKLKLLKNDQSYDFISATIQSEAYSENSTAYEEEIFHQKLQNGDVLIMMDGFDEINSDYGEIVIEALQKFAKTSKCKFWITTRLEFKEILEKSFETMAFFFEPFNDKKQSDYLSRFWQKMFQKSKKTELDFHIYEIHTSRFYRYAGAIIKIFNTSINDEYNAFLGQPLLLRMIAEIFQQKDPLLVNEERENCFDYVKSEEDRDPIVTSLNIFQLYDEFMTKKINLHLDKKHTIDTNTNEGQELAQYFHKKQYKMLQHFGLMRILSSEANTELLNAIISSKAKKKMNKWKDSQKRGIKDIGIINTFADDGNAHFIHLTFAEYFAVSYIVEHLFLDENLISPLFQAFNNILSPNMQVSLSFFVGFYKKYPVKLETLKVVLEETTFRNFAIKYEYANIMVALQGNKCSFPQIDKWGKTSLHYAVINHRNFYFMVILFQMFCSIMESTRKRNERKEYERHFPRLESFESAYKTLLQYVNLKDNDGNTALQMATSSSQIEKILKELKTDEDITENTNYENLLFDVFTANYLAYFIKCAYDNENYEFCKALMTHSVDFEWFTETMQVKIQYSPLWLIILRASSRKRHLFREITSVMFECIENTRSNSAIDGSSGQLETKIISSVLLLACRHGYIEFFQDIDEKYIISNYTMYFIEACFYRQSEIFDYLLKYFPNDIYSTITAFCSGTSLEFIDQKIRKNIIQEAVTEFLKAASDSENMIEASIPLFVKNQGTGKFEIVENSKCLIKQWISSNLHYLGSITDGSIYNDSPVDAILTEALLYNNERTIKQILQNCRKIPDLENEDFKEMLNYYKFVNNKPGENYFTGNILHLHKAVSRGSEVLVEFFLQKGADVNEKDQNGKTAFQLACEQNTVGKNIIAILLCYGAVYDVPMENITNKEVKEILKAANNVFIKKNFLPSKEDSYVRKQWEIPFLSAKNVNNETWLHLMRENMKHQIYSLFEHCYQYDLRDAVDKAGNTALHKVVQKNFLNFAVMLLEKGIMYNAENNLHVTVEDIIIEKLQRQRKNISGQYGNDDYAKTLKILQNINMSFNYVQNNEVEKLKKLISSVKRHGYFFSVRDKEGKCLLHYAKEMQIVTFLLKKRNKGIAKARESQSNRLYYHFMKVMWKIDTGKLFFFTADNYKCLMPYETYFINCFEHILSYKSINLCDFYIGKAAAYSPTIMQFFKNNSRKWLFFETDSLMIRDIYNKTPLFYAVLNDDTRIFLCMLQAGAMFNGDDYFAIKKPNTCLNLIEKLDDLFEEISNEIPSCIKRILKDICTAFNINVKDIVNVRDKEGNTLLHYAYKWKQKDNIKFLKECSADESIKNEERKLPKEMQFKPLDVRLFQAQKGSLSSEDISKLETSIEEL